MVLKCTVFITFTDFHITLEVGTIGVRHPEANSYEFMFLSFKFKTKKRKLCTVPEHGKYVCVRCPRSVIVDKFRDQLLWPAAPKQKLTKWSWPFIKLGVIWIICIIRWLLTLRIGQKWTVQLDWVIVLSEKCIHHHIYTSLAYVHCSEVYSLPGALVNSLQYIQCSRKRVMTPWWKSSLHGSSKSTFLWPCRYLSSTSCTEVSLSSKAKHRLTRIPYWGSWFRTWMIRKKHVFS